MLKIERPSGFDITDERVRVHFRDGEGIGVAELSVTVNGGEIDVTVRRFEDDPTVKFTVV